ncbi:MAG: LysR family transcriptional regulator, nitrogen assimilation regulatory protein, partial [Variovorax sp.]|nr:LysR family transcriptional regulator, nitrogen assimilation regulatory protein [Variovorax sp.]
MTVNFKTLKSFVTAVDVRSLSAAAAQLGVAQPALSQHIASLEEHFKVKLLNRSSAGVAATIAGGKLYRQALVMLTHLEQIERELDVDDAQGIGGPVALGLATYSTASALSIPLLQAVRREHPAVNLFINDNFGLILSEMVMTGRLDMAIIYGGNPVKGIELQPLLTEELFLIAPAGLSLPGAPDEPLHLAELGDIDLLLPSRLHTLRQVVDDAFASIGVTPNIRAEIESAATLRQAIDMGIGATILPSALANFSRAARPPMQRKIVGPSLRATVSLCLATNRVFTPQAKAVLTLLRACITDLLASGQSDGIE